jgi:hypothetical protein
VIFGIGEVTREQIMSPDFTGEIGNDEESEADPVEKSISLANYRLSLAKRKIRVSEGSAGSEVGDLLGTEWRLCGRLR